MRRKDGCRCSLDEQQTRSSAPRSTIRAGRAQREGGAVAKPAEADLSVGICPATISSITIRQIKADARGIRCHMIIITRQAEPDTTTVATSYEVITRGEIYCSARTDRAIFPARKWRVIPTETPFGQVKLCSGGAGATRTGGCSRIGGKDGICSRIGYRSDRRDLATRDRRREFCRRARATRDRKGAGAVSITRSRRIDHDATGLHTEWRCWIGQRSIRVLRCRIRQDSGRR